MLRRVGDGAALHRTLYISFPALLVICSATAAWAGPAREGVSVRYSSATSAATFVTGRNGGPIPVTPAPGRGVVRPADFLAQHGDLFGVTDPARQLRETEAVPDHLGRIHTTYKQVHKGVAVFAGTLKIHQRKNGEVFAANGDFYPIPASLDVVPELTAARAAGAAEDALGINGLTIERGDLLIVDPGWYGDSPIGPHLAYHVILSDPAAALREAFFIDATTGEILDQWNLLETARYREVRNRHNGPDDSPADIVRWEDEVAPNLDVDEANRAFDYSGDFYDFFWRMFGRDSWDDASGKLESIVNHECIPGTPGCTGQTFCPNAFWDGAGASFCTYTEWDDVVAHEFGHAVTGATADLIYQNQSGQLNESYSDIWGEMIDLFNGNVAFPGEPSGTPWPTPTFPPYVGPGVDTPNNRRTPDTCSIESAGYTDGVRWLLGEDSKADQIGGFGGAIRDMWEPTCHFQPNTANHPLQTCGGPDGLDEGGVHSGSGVPNHAFAILTDGKSFNGFTVTGIGPIKASAVWYQALVYYLWPSSDFKDAYLALNQAAEDLIGTTPNDPRTGLPWVDANAEFTAVDAQQVDLALRAVEMHTNGRCGASPDVVSHPNPPECMPQDILFGDDFEGGVNGWTVENSGPTTPYDWVRVGNLPFDRPGIAWFIDNRGDLACGNGEQGVHSLMSPEVVIPTGLSEAHKAKLAFTHYMASERFRDGGNIKIEVNGGGWMPVDEQTIEWSKYNELLVQAGGAANPMEGQRAWSGVGGVWGVTVVDLTSYNVEGATVRFKFDFGKDDCNGVDGWYVDDFRVYICACDSDAFCDDGVFCTGQETCVGGFCQAGTSPCGADYCSEADQACVAAAFWDDFENGNVKGWVVGGPDDTATEGAWEIGDPVGTDRQNRPVQPEDSAVGLGCAFTQQGVPGIPDFHDVDNGTVYMVSPAIDLSGQSGAELTYYRWFYQDNGFDGRNDYFAVDASSDDGASWVNLETVTAHQISAWQPMTIFLQDFFPRGGMTSTMRLRFATSAEGPIPDDLVEGAVDEVVLISTGACAANKGDRDGNCVVDLADYANWSGCLSGPGMPYPQGCDTFDFEIDNDVDLEDMRAFLAVFGTP